MEKNEITEYYRHKVGLPCPWEVDEDGLILETREGFYKAGEKYDDVVERRREENARAYKEARASEAAQEPVPQ